MSRGNRFLVLGASAVVLLSSGFAASVNAQATETTPKIEQVDRASLPTIEIPEGYEEGYLPKLSEIDIKEVEQFARNSSADLKDLLDMAAKISDYWEKREILKRGIDAIIKKSKPLKTELLMRNVLERAAILVNLIDAEVQNDLKRKGVVDQEVRLMKSSIVMSLKYWEPYLKHVNGQTATASVDLAKINYREFGINYHNLLWSVANSIYDASAEYKLRFESLKLLMWDLYRDENKLESGQAGAISKLYNLAKNAPDPASWSDDQYVEHVKMLRILRKEAFSRLGVNPAGSEAAVAAPIAAVPAPQSKSDPVRAYCSILFPEKKDKRENYCYNAFTYTYNGYLFRASNACYPTITAALASMWADSSCTVSDSRGRCKILYPDQKDGRENYCYAKYGVTYNGYMKANVCHDSYSDALRDMLSDAACQ